MTQARLSRAYDDLRVAPNVRGTGSNNPAFEKWFDDAGLAIVTAGGTSRGTFLYSFDDAAAANEKEVFFFMQLPHSWAATIIHMHVHWVGSHTQATATPRWGLEYNWKEPNATFGATTTTYATGMVGGSANITAGIHYITEFPDLTPDSTQDGLSSILTCRLFRNSSNAADTYTTAGNKCGLLFIDAHFEADSLGSISEYTK